MPIQAREIFWTNNERLENERRQRTEALLEYIQSMPSHNYWFDPNNPEHKLMVEELIIAQQCLRDLDQRLAIDPMQFNKLEKNRTSTAARVNKLRTSLGMTASMIKKLTPKQQQNEGLLAVLGDTDYQE